MTYSDFSPELDDLEDFAKWNGFEGSDFDQFYETYYGYEKDYYDDYEAPEDLDWDP